MIHYLTVTNRTKPNHFYIKKEKEKKKGLLNRFADVKGASRLNAPRKKLPS